MGQPPENGPVNPGSKPEPEKKPARAANTRGKAQAAVAETKAEEATEAKSVEYEGLTLTLPTEFPEELFFDMIESEASGGGENPTNEYLIQLRILRSLLGPDQFMEVRHKLGRDSEKVWGLANIVLDEFGLTMGESEASPES